MSLGTWGVLAALALGFATASCAPDDQKEFQSRLAATQKQLQSAWASANDQARHIDPSSTQQDIDKAMDALHKQAIVASSESQKQVQAVKEQIDRLNLAQQAKDLKAKAESDWKDYDEIQQKAQKGLDEGEKIKQEAYDDYQKAHAEYVLAQKAYDDATKRAQAAWDAATAP